MQRPRLFTVLALVCWLPLSGGVWAGKLSDQLGTLLDSDISSEILDPEDAFRLSVGLDDGIIRLSWDIAPGYYLYHDKIRLEVLDGVPLLGPLDIPSGTIKQDDFFGEVQVHYAQLSFDVPLLERVIPPERAALVVYYQGCKEDVLCYPPVRKIIDLTFTDRAITSLIVLEEEGDPYAATPSKVAEQDAITQYLLSGHFIFNLLMFFGLGLLLSVTPCIFPMLPILSGVIVGQGSNISVKRGFFISLCFVLAMALTYAVLGVFAGLFGLNLQAISQHTIGIVLFSSLFLLLALSMFGYYELRLPARWQDKLYTIGQGGHGGIKRAMIMGGGSALIVSPCIAPPLAGALLYISQTGDLLLGGAALFMMGLGFGVPLLILGASAGNLLPKAGPWMGVVRAVFGVLMLGVAIWLLQRILTESVSLLLWAILFIVSAVYMGALDRVEATSLGLRFSKGLGLVVLFYGVLMLFGSVSGGGTLTDPLNGFYRMRAVSAPSQAQLFTEIKDEITLDQALASARRSGRPVMLDFYADWCVTCKQLERSTFPHESVQKWFANMVLLRVDVTENTLDDQALLRRFSLFGPPALVFFDRYGQELGDYRLVGFMDAASFSQHLASFIMR